MIKAPTEVQVETIQQRCGDTQALATPCDDCANTVAVISAGVNEMKVNRQETDEKNACSQQDRLKL